MTKREELIVSLSNVNWKEFVLDDVFDITSSKSQINKSKLNRSNDGLYPYITRSVATNGVDDFVSEQSGYGLNNGNVITIGLDTQTVYYQPYDFYTGQNIQILRNKVLNKYVALFLIPLIELQMGKFNWGGNGATLTRLKKVQILLPVDPNGNPDWSFMENFMKEVETLVQPSMNFTEHVITDNRELDDVEWGEFVMGELFTLDRGKRLIKTDRLSGDIPYYSASGERNGLTDFISNPLFVDSDKILVSTFCDAYFVEGEFTASDEMTILSHERLNKYIGLFISMAIRDNKSKYAFGWKAFTNRISSQKILLPVDSNGNPDWDFMEQYMKRIENNLMKRVENVVA